MSTKRKRPSYNIDGEFEVWWWNLPVSPQELALPYVLDALGLDEHMLDIIGDSSSQTDKTYWTSLIEAVTSCNVGHGKKTSVMSPEAIRELHKTANEDEQPATFLFEFAQETLVLRRQLTKGSVQAKSPDAIFAYALDHFAPFEDFDLGEVNHATNLRERVGDNSAHNIASQIIKAAGA